MVSFDREVANPTIADQRRKVVEMPEDNHPEVTSMRTLKFLKWGE
jgi:hypothetical protein